MTLLEILNLANRPQDASLSRDKPPYQMGNAGIEPALPGLQPGALPTELTSHVTTKNV